MIFTEAGEQFETVIQHAPTGLTNIIGVRLLDSDGNVVIPRFTAGIIEKPAGSGLYRALMTAPLTEASYLVLWDTDPGGVANPSNSASEEVVVTVGAIVGVIPSPGLLPGGPCELWISGSDLAGFCGISSPDIDKMDTAAALATQFLYMWSGRIYSGRCQRTVRPCRRGCGCFDSIPGVGWWWGGEAWAGYGPGSWWPGYQPSLIECGCSRQDRIRLPYPARAVTAVRIDGVALPANDYRIDNRKWLVRLSNATGPAWPGCQDLSLPAGATGTFEIDVAYGSRPPLAGVQAAYALGCQLYKLDTTGTCDIPANATQVIRQGVTISLQNFFRSTPAGFTIGVPIVDAFLNAYNPHGHQRRPAVWSPDVQQTARKVGP